MNKKIVKYYTVNDSRRKFETIDAAKKAYENFYCKDIDIIEHVEKTTKCNINQNFYNNTFEDKQAFIINALSKLLKKLESGELKCSDIHWGFFNTIRRALKELTLVINGDNKSPMDYDTIETVFKEKYSKKENEIFIDFIKTIIDKYPLECADVVRLNTDYKPCNAICIIFNNLIQIFPDVIINLDESGYRQGLKKKQVFKNISLCIQFRGDKKDKDIVVDNGVNAYGRNTNTKNYTQVDLKSQKNIDYINSVIGC